MKRFLPLLVLATLGACAPLGQALHRGPKVSPAAEANYAQALSYLESPRSTATLDTAVMLLDSYLSHRDPVQRRAEAVVLRRLAADAIQLTRVTAALQQERAAGADTRVKAGDPPAPAQARPDTDALREIHRLKEELAAANAELERIRKRLATQNP